MSSFETFLGETVHINFLILIGIAMFVGTVGAKVFQKVHIPQVVGYLAAGLVIGGFGLHLFSEKTLDAMTPINYFALGIIGFLVGGELSSEVFKKYGKQFLAMVLAEGLVAFALVAIFVGLVAWFFTHNFVTSLILGLVLGAIASATDPATSIQVFWEYRTRGALTTTSIAIGALDDAQALALYAISTSISGIVAGVHSGGVNLPLALERLAYELIGALSLGFLMGSVLKFTYEHLRDEDKLLPYTVGLILLTLGIAQALEFDIILSSMTFGLAFVNMVPIRSENAFNLIKKFAPPIYVLFFVFVGASLNVSYMSILVGVLTVVYIIGRSAGKSVGVWAAAKLSGASEKVQKYTGLCLFPQAGVAVGLSIVASQHFHKDISSVIITVVALTTLILQLIGPPLIKIAVKKAGEVDRNITEDDLAQIFHVKEVMEKKPLVLSAGSTLNAIIEMFSSSNAGVIFIQNNKGEVIGSVTLENIRSALASPFMLDMVIAHDVMMPINESVSSDMPLHKAMKLLDETTHSAGLPVVDNGSLVGVIEHKKVNAALTAEIIKRRQD